MRGRKPKPSFLKIVEGNPGRRPLNAREPRAIGALSDPPEWMTAAQCAIWRDAIADAPRGLLRRIDASVLAVWVIAYETQRRAVGMQARLDAHGGAELLTKNPRGELRQSPYVQIIRQQAAVMLKAASELGFTPSSRSRVQVGDDESEKGALAEFLA